MLSVIVSFVTLTNGDHHASIQKFTNLICVYGPFFTEICSRKSHIEAHF